MPRLLLISPPIPAGPSRLRGHCVERADGAHGAGRWVGRVVALAAFALAFLFVPDAAAQSENAGGEPLLLRCGGLEAEAPRPVGAGASVIVTTPLGDTRSGAWCIVSLALESGGTWRALLHSGHDGLIVEQQIGTPVDLPVQYALTDLDRDGDPELLATRGQDDCGMPGAYLEPRVYSAEQGELRSVTLRPTTAGVERAATQPATALASPQWAVPLTFASHTASGVPGGGPNDALGTAEADDAAWRPATDIGGVGAWGRVRIPDVHVGRAIELRAVGDTLTLLLSTPGWVRQVEVSDQALRVGVPENAGCVTVQIARASGSAGAALDVARVVTEASEQADWVGEWAIPALERACAESAVSTSRIAQTLSTETSDFTALTDSSSASNSCVRGAVYTILAGAPPDDARRVDWLLAAPSSALRDAIIETTVLRAGDWLDALLAARGDAQTLIATLPHTSDSAPGAATTLWPPSPDVPDVADRLLDGVRLAQLSRAELAADAILARRAVAIVARATPGGPAPSWLPPFLRDALAHRDGTVARLALATIEAHALTSLEGDVRTLLRDDPLPHLRAAALSAWLAVSAENPEPLLAELATTDPSPTVRLAAAERWAAPVEALLSAGLAETWPEIQFVYADRLVALAPAEAPPLLTALLSSDARLPLPAECPPSNWAPLVDAAEPGTRSFRQLVYALASCSNDDWLTRLGDAADRAAAHARPAWLVAGAGTPLVLPLAQRWLDSDELDTALLSAEVLWREGGERDRERVRLRASQDTEPSAQAAWGLLLRNTH